MAFETTHILLTKLDLLASHGTNFPGLKSQVINNSIQELKHLQNMLESSENYQRSNKTLYDEEDKLDEWDKLLDDIYSLEDDIESLTMLLSHKVQRRRHTSSSFSSEVSLSKKIEQLTERVKGYCNKIQPSSSSGSGVSSEYSVPPIKSLPSSSSGSGVPSINSVLPIKSSTDTEDLQVSTDNETVTSNAAMFVLSDLVKKLSQQLLSRLTLQYLILTVDGAYLGKAILLWTVYSADDIERHFQCRAWVRVIEERGQREILLDILKQVTGAKVEERLLLQAPQRRLHDFLVSKRYLIVLYGVQTAEFWNNIKAAFPYSLNGSRLIIVVESDSVARQINSWAGGRHYSSNSKKLKGQLSDRWPQASTYLEDEYGITSVMTAIDKLTQSILNPHILPFLIKIKGTVGSGRTTMLWPIYNAKDVKQHFQCRAWVHVTQEFRERDVLTNIYEQVTSTTLHEKLPVDLLRKRLHDFLAQKRYLVVLCEVWTNKIWDELKFFLPSSLNGSRVIFILSGGEASKEQQTSSSISGMIMPVRKWSGLKDVEGNQKGADHCNTLFDVKDEESSIVCLHDKVRELEELTLNSYKLHLLIPVLGVAGSGKTTLVRKIYNSVASKKHFRCRAWVNVSLKLDDFNEKKLLIDLLGQLRNAKQKESPSLLQLRERLRLFLTWKRYLIVLDDVPTPDVWEILNPFFPNLSNGSRVIITTRNAYLAYHINPETVVLQLRPLTDSESWALFLQSAKKMQIDISLKDKMLQRCHGLPLLIVLLGGMLSMKDNYDEWLSVIERSTRKMETKRKVRAEDQMNPSGKLASSDTKQTNNKASGKGQTDVSNQPTSVPTKQKEEKRKFLIDATSGKEHQSNASDQLIFSDRLLLSDTMALAYQDLAPHLKCCLLYLGLFPKSYEIPLRRLYHLWLAEGFVIPADQVKTPPEKLVEEYFEELRSRNMVEVAKLKLDGSPKACRVPNTIYDTLFLDKEKVGFFHISTSSGTWGSPWFNIRRLSENFDTSLQSEQIENRVRRLHSYISFYGKRGAAPTYGVKELLSKVVDKGFGILRVLDLEGLYKPVLSDTLGKLPCLRYLGLRRTLLDDLPQSVGELSQLETLDIKHTFITKLPSTIWNAKKLQHLYTSDIDIDMSTIKPSAGSLNNLKTLWGLLIKKGSFHRNWLKALAGLSKLKLTCNEASNEVIAPWLSQMDKLQSLHLRLIDKFNQPLDLRVDAMPKNLSQLYLLGKLPSRVPAIDLPENLEILTLSMTHLSEDPMSMLGKLKQLKVLRLYAQSFLGSNMTCSHGGFPKLRVLKLWMLHKLSLWTVKEGAMPMLREAEIRCCKNLQLPVGLDKLMSLKELTLTNMKEDFVANLERSMKGNIAIMKNLCFTSSWE